jgi:hypothetical protein
MLKMLFKIVLKKVGNGQFQGCSHSIALSIAQCLPNEKAIVSSSVKVNKVTRWAEHMLTM